MKLILIASELRCYIILIFFSKSFVKSEKYKDTRLATVFEDHLLIPCILPSKPEELCTIIYQPNFIITTAQPYYVYQIQSLPEIVWDYKSEKYYTVVVMGAVQNEVQRPTTISPLAHDDTDYSLKAPEQSWHHWVIVDVRRNDLNTGTVIQPFNVNSNIPQPNVTHKVVYTFAIFEQPKKLKIQVDDKENSPKALLESYFTPLSNYLKSFEGSVLVAGNFFYAVFKPEGLVLDSSPVRNLILKAIKNRMALLVPVLLNLNHSNDEEPYFTRSLKEHLIVPHLLPSCPKDLCSVIYDPNLIIVAAEQYYYYQIQGVPEVTWEYKKDKYYTLIVLGAFRKEIVYPSTTAPVLRNLSETLTPPEGWWHQWVIVDIRGNGLEAGCVVQPYLRSTIAEPNSTCRIIYTFVVYEQPKKLDLKLLDEKGLPTSNSLLAQFFSPISNFEKSFNGCIPVAGNFFQVVHKPEHLVLDTSVIRILKTGFFRR